MTKLTHAAKVLVAKSAKAVVTANANSSCIFVVHQPKMPAGAKKLRKF